MSAYIALFFILMLVGACTVTTSENGAEQDTNTSRVKPQQETLYTTPTSFFYLEESALSKAQQRRAFNAYAAVIAQSEVSDPAFISELADPKNFSQTGLTDVEWTTYVGELQKKLILEKGAP